MQPGMFLVITLDVYNDTVKFPGDDTYLPSTGNGTITVIPIPIHITVGNVTVQPGENVTIPINVTRDDDVPFNGNITAELPDGTTKAVEIVNGTGNLTWFVPEDYSPDNYPNVIKFPGSDIYESNGTGIIEVVKIPTHVSVGNITTFAGRNVNIPINVTADDGLPFNGNVTITLPK